MIQINDLQISLFFSCIGTSDTTRMVAILLSVLLWYTDYVCPFGIFKLFTSGCMCCDIGNDLHVQTKFRSSLLHLCFIGRCYVLFNLFVYIYWCQTRFPYQMMFVMFVMLVVSCYSCVVCIWQTIVCLSLFFYCISYSWIYSFWFPLWYLQSVLNTNI